MYRKLFLLAATIVMAAIATAACSAQAANPQQPSSAPANAPANAPAPAAQTVPLCQASTTCQAPEAVLHQTDCVNKIPYTNVLVSPGTAYEVLDKSGDFTCKDSGNVVDGKTVLTCYGTQLHAFDLKLTNSSCNRPNLQQGTGQCQAGYGYDAAQQCCAQLAPDTSGSTAVHVDLGACPLPQVHNP